MSQLIAPAQSTPYRHTYRALGQRELEVVKSTIQTISPVIPISLWPTSAGTFAVREECLVLLGNGGGTFQEAITYGSGGIDSQSVAIGDLNGDGRPDVIIVNACPTSGWTNGYYIEGTVGVLLGNGDGTFQTAGAYNSGGLSAESALLADVNSNGKLDIVVANVCGLVEGIGSCSGRSVTVLIGNGDGTFVYSGNYHSGGTCVYSVAVAHVNGDGYPDLIAANCSASVACFYDNGVLGVLLGNGHGTFRAPVKYGSGET